MSFVSLGYSDTKVRSFVENERKLVTGMKILERALQNTPKGLDVKTVEQELELLQRTLERLRKHLREMGYPA